MLNGLDDEYGPPGGPRRSFTERRRAGAQTTPARLAKTATMRGNQAGGAFAFHLTQARHGGDIQHEVRAPVRQARAHPHRSRASAARALNGGAGHRQRRLSAAAALVESGVRRSHQKPEQLPRIPVRRRRAWAGSRESGRKAARRSPMGSRWPQRDDRNRRAGPPANRPALAPERMCPGFSKPSMSGIWQSIRIRSKASRDRSSRASRRWPPF